MRSLLAAFILPIVLARTVELHHRLIIPTTSTAGVLPDWTPLGSIEVSPEVVGRSTLTPAPATSKKIDLSDTSAKEDGAWYQVGVETDEGWVYGSTRACFLVTSPRIEINLEADQITSLSLHAQGSVSGSCPAAKAAGLTVSPLGIKVDLVRPTLVNGPSTAAAPAPQPTDPKTGLPQAPPPEKTFLQKYWLPLIGLAVFIVGQMAAPDQPQQGAKAK